MLSWITGSRITNAVEDVQTGYESTILEAPETPAHQFAVKAFKHAIFGTPAAAPAEKVDEPDTKPACNGLVNEQLLKPPSGANIAVNSPSKQPSGILRTPITASKSRKTVTFGAQVLDNEGKRSNVSRSGIPSDCPGKFPSPWTPGIDLKLESGSIAQPRSKLTTALLEARQAATTVPGQKPRARDDSDITMDLSVPRSESGKFWKEQYESYASRSEKEAKQLIAKQQLAKHYAKKKDNEVTELRTEMEQERKRYRRRERELEQQNKDYQEQLRKALADMASSIIEISALKSRIATLESSKSLPTSRLGEKEARFAIHEDLVGTVKSVPIVTEDKASYFPSTEKENAPLETLDRSFFETVQCARQDQKARIILAKSPQKSTKPSLDAQVPVQNSEITYYSPLRLRDSNINEASKMQANLTPSSPLPQPSPDPWMEPDSSFAPVPRMALPLSCAPISSKTSQAMKTSQYQPASSRTPATRTNRLKKSQSAHRAKAVQVELSATEPKLNRSQPAPGAVDAVAAGDLGDKTVQGVSTDIRDKQILDSTSALRNRGAASLYAGTNGSLHKVRERAEPLPVDRKEQARQRLLERRRRKEPVK